MKLVFDFKIKQKLLLNTLVLAMLFFASCSASRNNKVASRPAAKTQSTQVTRKVPSLKAEERAVKVFEPDTKPVPARTSKKIDRVISEARTFIGTPYRYGGTTRAGMDCSGLLMNSFKVVKVNLPRSSDAQSRVGTEVKMKDLEPGDLVFFATGKNKKQVTHVGLVTQKLGKNDVKFIHASSSLGVVETNISGEYYQQRFVSARRVLD